ncbi:MAG: hypothetical protein J5662_01080, partial [Clostridia bacterium]|nr:hypothetical protein [Clostridia bacterium]
MYHITASGNNVKPLQKTANLVKGNTYTAKFKYKMVSGTYNTSFFFFISKAQQIAENVTGKGAKYFDGREDSQFISIDEGTDGWRTLAYTFLFDDYGDVTIPSGTVKTDLGFKIDRRVSEFYIADFEVYDINDPTHTNLFLVSDASQGVWDWHSDYYTSSVNDVSFETSAYIIECLEMDESLFSIPPVVHSMLHVVNYGRKYQYLVQHVNLEKGNTYTLEFLYHFDAGDFNSSVYVWFGGAQNYKTGRKPTTYFMSHRTDALKFDSVRYATNMSKVSYTFTLNDESGTYELPEGEQLYSVGFTFENANTGAITDLYVADMTLYDCEDDNETNLLPVTDYSKGLYGWGCQWAGAEMDSESFT